MGFSSPFPLDQTHKERGDVEVNPVSPQAARLMRILFLWKILTKLEGGKMGTFSRLLLFTDLPHETTAMSTKLPFWQGEGGVCWGEVEVWGKCGTLRSCSSGKQQPDGKTKKKGLSLHIPSWHFWACSSPRTSNSCGIRFSFAPLPSSPCCCWASTCLLCWILHVLQLLSTNNGYWKSTTQDKAVWGHLPIYCSCFRDCN